MRTRIVVPLPALDSICIVAPTSEARSCMPDSPRPCRVVPASPGSNPTPSSSTMSTTCSTRRSRITSTWRRSRMLGDVGQRLLRDPIERGLDLGGQPIVR